MIFRSSTISDLCLTVFDGLRASSILLLTFSSTVFSVWQVAHILDDFRLFLVIFDIVQRRSIMLYYNRMFSTIVDYLPVFSSIFYGLR